MAMIEHTYLGDYPDEVQADWTDECQGVTHDRDHWFITQKNAVWRVPIGKDLQTPLRHGVDGVRRGLIPVEGYDHFGDPDFHGETLYAPLEGSRRFLFWTRYEVPRIAALTGNDLRLRWSALLSQQQQAPWCAVNAERTLYSSSSRVTPRVERRAGPLFRYRLEEAGLTLIDRVILRDEQGTPLVLDSVQGGAFADDRHLYISCGYYKDPKPSWGIHLFDMRTQRRIARSTNGHGPFNYEFHAEDPYDEEPEGLTWWDLDPMASPGISGQLHAILLDNDSNGDDVYFKHYRVEGLPRSLDPRQVAAEPQVVAREPV
jgi:hypothetical protein